MHLQQILNDLTQIVCAKSLDPDAYGRRPFISGERQEGVKISIKREYNSIFFSSALQDLLILRSGHSQF